jgi:SEC-C motif domain protein
MPASDSDLSCPCSSGKQYQRCCEPYLLEKKIPQTPEQLMRSRYCAFALVKVNYIQATMRDAALKKFDFKDTREWTAGLRWLDLKVLHSEQQADVGYVEFIARYISAEGTEESMHEKSKFKRCEGRWYYVNAVQLLDHSDVSKKIGRNDPCHCGSGRKFKKCCGD